MLPVTEPDSPIAIPIAVWERVKRTDRIKLRYSNFDSEDDNEYHVAEEEEDLKNFQICPAKPNQSNTEYADREPRKPMPTETGQSWEPSSWDIPPRPPKRPIPGNPAPAVNRDLKPSRRPKSPLGLENISQKTREPSLNCQYPSPLQHDPKPPYQKTCQPTLELAANKREPLGEIEIPLSPVTDIPWTWKRKTLTERDATSGIRLHHEWPQTKEDKNNSSYTPQSKPLEVSDEEDWYVGSFSRVEAEHALHLVNREGAFLVRDCSKNTSNEPFVLVVFYDKRVFNIQIRFSEATRKYTLGTGLRTNDLFDSVADIIKFHSIFPIVLIDGRSSAGPDRAKRTCVLMYPVTKKDMAQLLG
ncbi:cytokine-dependent hematopoietic cell linker [Chanos chanos]|uniref:Cytokine-dependent hematopoietic cell linker n=1 Tax=Chanos chanos TaxID=29144 RepID=A0A6J2UPN8_CHACN|nr:cytokine-dependent hematopoietic cell linker [Chanos chanos]